MTQGPNERTIIERSVKSHRPLPDAIANAPVLMEGLALYYEAFWELSTCRHVDGMGGIGSIPWLAIREYTKMLDLDNEMSQDLHYYVRAMDEEFLKHVRSQHGKS